MGKDKCCSKCNNIKPIDDFHFRNKAAGTVVSYCKSCYSDYQKGPEVSDKRREKRKTYKYSWSGVRDKDKANERQKERYDSDPGYRFKISLRRRHNKVFKGSMSTTKGLGCTSKQLEDHLVSQFQEGMTLENHGEWHLDHKVPVSTAEMGEDGNPLDTDYNRRLIYYKNLQPLWEKDNLEKGDKIIPEYLEQLMRGDYFD